MGDQPVTVSKISWRDIFPALIILRSLSGTLSIAVIILATAGLLLTPLGWIVSDWIFVSDDMRATNDDLASLADINRSPYESVYPNWNTHESLITILGNPIRGVDLVYLAYIRSPANLFRTDLGFQWFGYLFLGSVWTLAVWSLFGCAISRWILMRYTRDETIGLSEAVKFAGSRFLSCFGGVAIPLIAVGVLAIPAALLGLLMATNFGAVIGGIMWFLVLLASVLMAVILLGLALCWPLIIAAVSAEGQDAFDGMCRAYAYVLQRPIHFFLYVLLAIIFSGFCWLVVSLLVQMVVETSFWAVSWGANVSDNRVESLAGNAAPELDEAGEEVPTSGMLKFAQGLIRFWNGLAWTVGAAFLYGLFWTIVSAIYLLLRKDLDDTEMDEIYLDEDHRTYELPPLKAGEDGIPAVDEEQILPAEVDETSQSATGDSAPDGDDED